MPDISTMVTLKKVKQKINKETLWFYLFFNEEVNQKVGIAPFRLQHMKYACSYTSASIFHLLKMM